MNLLLKDFDEMFNLASILANPSEKRTSLKHVLNMS